ncbi:hypothetical protein I4O98_017705 [Clostridioides difficile]
MKKDALKEHLEIEKKRQKCTFHSLYKYSIFTDVPCHIFAYLGNKTYQAHSLVVNS